MPLDKRFIRADISELDAQTHKLVITYSYYNLYRYSTTYVYKTQNECFLKLAFERCQSGTLLVRKANGELQQIDPGAG